MDRRTAAARRVRPPLRDRCACLWYTPLMDHLRDVPDDPPPFLGTWKRVYVAVMIYLAAIILAFYLFARTFR